MLPKSYPAATLALWAARVPGRDRPARRLRGGARIAMLLAGDKTRFFAIGGLMGVFFGPAQAASRLLTGWLAPKGQEELSGLHAFVGRSTAFEGPWHYGK